MRPTKERSESPRLGTGHGLGEAEQERQVAVNALAFNVRPPGCLPGAGDLDEDALAANPGLLVQSD